MFFRYFLSMKNAPTIANLQNILEACTYVLWELTGIVKNEERKDSKLDFIKNVVTSLKSILPALLDWSANLESLIHVEAYSKVLRMYFFLANDL